MAIIDREVNVNIGISEDDVQFLKAVGHENLRQIAGLISMHRDVTRAHTSLMKKYKEIDPCRHPRLDREMSRELGIEVGGKVWCILAYYKALLEHNGKD